MLRAGTVACFATTSVSQCCMLLYTQCFAAAARDAAQCRNIGQCYHVCATCALLHATLHCCMLPYISYTQCFAERCPVHALFADILEGSDTTWFCLCKIGTYRQGHYGDECRTLQQSTDGPDVCPTRASTETTWAAQHKSNSKAWSNTTQHHRAMPKPAHVHLHTQPNSISPCDVWRATTPARAFRCIHATI